MKPVVTEIVMRTPVFSVQVSSWPLVKSFMLNVRLGRVAEPRHY